MGIQVHEDRFGVVQSSLTPTTLSPGSSRQSFSFIGLTTAMVVVVNPPAGQTSGVGIAGARVVAADMLEINFFANVTASAVTGVYSVFWFKPEVTGLQAVQP